MEDTIPLASSCNLREADLSATDLSGADLSEANLLSASISEAMNCTAFGLMTAVPIVMIHAFLTTKTTELINGLEMACTKFLNAVTERSTLRAQGRLGLVQPQAQAAQA